jgi:hypothetical protein
MENSNALEQLKASNRDLVKVSMFKFLLILIRFNINLQTSEIHLSLAKLFKIIKSKS